MADPLPGEIVEAHEALLSAYRSVARSEAAKKRMLPGLMADLTATPEWIAAVAQANAAQSGLLDAARRFCALSLRDGAPTHLPAEIPCRADPGKILGESI